MNGVALSGRVISLNVFADDVSRGSGGNVKTGVSNTNAELEAAGGSGERTGSFCFAGGRIVSFRGSRRVLN
ncbi:MAG: hypothetical protein OEW04_11310 [Nitrospirota bacterium]|nr:hypothetical protein [Nitrospirota bacterium]